MRRIARLDHLITQEDEWHDSEILVLGGELA
jgi:hypothetical protein